MPELTDFEPTLFTIDQIDDVAIVTVTATRLTEEENIEEFGYGLFSLVDHYQIRQIVIDLSAVKYASSAAIGKLITLHRRANRAGGKLVLYGVEGDFRDILDASRLLTYFDVAETRDEAIAASAETA